MSQRSETQSRTPLPGGRVKMINNKTAVDSIAVGGRFYVRFREKESPAEFILPEILIEK